MEPDVEAGRPGLVDVGGSRSPQDSPAHRLAHAGTIDLRDRPEDDAGVERGPWTEALQQLARALVRAVSLDDVAVAVVAYGTAAAGARWTHVVLLDSRGEPGVSLLGGHTFPSRRLDHLGLEARLPWNDAVREGTTVAFPSTDELHRAYPELATACAVPSGGAVVTLPLTAPGRTHGAVTFGLEPGEEASPEQRALADITSLAAQAARRAAVYETEYHSADLLQRAFLPPRLPAVGDLSLASRYLPAGEPLAVGGDWYDAVGLPGPRVGLIIGDVAGHGIRAATVMASLRAAVRAFATVESSPSGILSRLNTYVCTFKPESFATVLVAIFDPADGRLRYASAGHPPAVLIGDDGTARLLAEPLGPPLGLPGTRYHQGEELLPRDCALVIYTDGLVERRDRTLDTTMAELVEATSASFPATPDELCDRLASRLLAGVDLFDDAAMVVAMRRDGDRSRRETR